MSRELAWPPESWVPSPELHKLQSSGTIGEGRRVRRSGSSLTTQRFLRPALDAKGGNVVELPSLQLQG